MTDENMAEVHAIKDAIGVQYANDPNAFFDELKCGEAELKAAGVPIIDPPANPASSPDSALQRTRFARR